MAIRFVTFSVWAAVAASAVAWFMPGFLSSGPAAPGAAVVQDGGVPPADWSALLTRAQAPADTVVTASADASRFRLLGVAGPLKPSGQGVALVSIDGKPARAFKPGQPIDDQRVVQEVTAHTVKIGPAGGPTVLTLQAPLLPPPATGTLPGAAM